MKVILALDSFKGRMSAEHACQVVRDAFLRVKPDLEVLLKPMADGGEGTAGAVLAARDGEWVPSRVTGPREGMVAEAGFAYFPDISAALVEMAAASGLILLSSEQLNPLETTTYGTGELIREAAKKNVDRLWLGVGGSATVDGGVGAAMALGWRFLDASGKAIGLGGAELQRICEMRQPDNLALPKVEVLCDVDNPLLGEHGAARVYGPQKGATPEMVEQLEAGLSNLAALVESQLGCSIADVPGAGAAGGLSAGAMAFMNASFVSGIDTVISLSGLRDELAKADWVITGEGKFDAQSLRGKVVLGIARAARGSQARVGVLAGSVHVTESQYREAGIEVALATQKEGMPLEHALEHAEELLAESAETFARKHLV